MDDAGEREGDLCRNESLEDGFRDVAAVEEARVFRAILLSEEDDEELLSLMLVSVMLDDLAVADSRRDFRALFVAAEGTDRGILVL